MRCLTLAAELSGRGSRCIFLSRSQPGDLVEEIDRRGYAVHLLSSALSGVGESLGDHQESDLRDSLAALARLPHGLVVADHYLLDERWEKAVGATGRPLAVIDDLANRRHACDLLLDQNPGRLSDHYRPLVPSHCQVLAGCEYALLRSEFVEWRTYSLQRRMVPRIGKLFISLGGGDQVRTLLLILTALQHAPLPSTCKIVVAVHQGGPELEAAQAAAARLPWAVEIFVGSSSIAEIMSESDLAIGAAGGMALERCCLGLPTLLVVLAENQRAGARALVEAGAALDLGDAGNLAAALPAAVAQVSDPRLLSEMTRHAAGLVDGLGAGRVARLVEKVLDCV
jgi:UDP-2,4-diacetamido-2,4,6-trideoxy-beta-L-altropyranose hydrolase